MLGKNARVALQPILAIATMLVLSGALMACAAFSDLKNRASLLVESITGMKCVVASVGPCFPCGLKATDITICSTSGTPLFQARELRTQVNPFRYLWGNGSRGDLLRSLTGDGITLVLSRNERGEWELPTRATPATTGSADGQDRPRRLSFSNVTILVKTANGEATRFYNKVQADLDPKSSTATLVLSGVNESATITLARGGTKQYALQAENFSTALLAPLCPVPLPLANLLVSGNLRAATNDGTHFTVTASGTLKTQGLCWRVLSSRAIEGLQVPFALQGAVSYAGVEDLVAKISLAGETAMLQGELQGWDKPVLDLRATFADFSYDRAISALPSSLHPSLPVIRLSGSMTGTFSMHIDLAEPERLEYSYSGRTDPLQILNLGQEIDLERLKGPFVHRVRMNPKQEMSILVSPDNPDFTPYQTIPFALRSAVMVAEDLGFFSHRGFSTTGIRGALIDNLKAGRVVRGASTISMQLAKNLFLSPERTLSRKLEEALITVAIEQHLDKQRILEIYLNIIEWGEGIYGIGPAARYYFGKRPAQLSALESAFLASIIARPKNWHPDPLPRLGQGWREYLRVILCKMYRMGAADVHDLIEAGVSRERLDYLMGNDSGADDSQEMPLQTALGEEPFSTTPAEPLQRPAPFWHAAAP